MNITDLGTFITTVGFPCAMCVLLFWFMYKQDNRHSEEVSKLSNTINENTKVLSELTILIKQLYK